MKLQKKFDKKRLEIARERDLDLVVVSPNQAPPVAKIMDWGKYKYETEKRAKEARKKQKVVELKGKISFKENEKPKILVDTIKELGTYSKLFVKIKCDEEEEPMKTKELFELLKGNEGEIPVYVYFENREDLKMLSRNWWISPTETFVQNISRHFGNENVKLV